MAAVLMAGCLSATPLQESARADEEGTKKTKARIQAEKAQLAIKLLGTAPEVAEFGRKEKAPEALIAAAGMLLKAWSLAGEPKEYDGTVEDKDGKKVDVPAEKAKTLKDQAKAIFEEARDLAKTNAEATAINVLIKATEARHKEEAREAITPLQVTRKVGAGGDHQYTVKFETHSPASVAFHSTHPVRFEILEPGPGKILELVGTSGHYTWSPKGEGATKNVIILVFGTNKMTEYTVYAK
jgi:hypothetical protein